MQFRHRSEQHAPDLIPHKPRIKYEAPCKSKIKIICKYKIFYLFFR
ncbi:hypothetical protein ALIPUT_01093 [Alistipes putredinis DSM 17216]|uniref:Uncharacterized protein n=1 Tax=Alistipes putredinis DSM 17216 TaxID=445970 RepID=B0MV93_9BACT|nr:hypothetical protein ALIPUT_01093 [Alistipes putredinis DSM 17216]